MKKLLFVSKNFEPIKVTRVEINAFLQTKLRELLPKIKSKEIYGSSPPEVFVGRMGYPKLFIGPIVSPLENSEDLLYTENWFGRSLEEIFALRFQAVRGKTVAKVKDLNNKNVQKLQEALLSRRSVEAEVKFKHIPRGFRISLYHQPFGPSAFIEDFKLYPSSTDFKLEKVFYDFDFKANEAIFWLYQNKMPISKIQQALSIGMLGVKRRLVPTRWSITAVDDIIGKFLLEKVKTYPQINEFRVYYKEYLDNRWIVLMFPSYWQYESIEAWYPGTIVDSLAIGGDYEGYEFKKEYANIGGCWYAARAMVAEKLFEERRQAGVLVLREIHQNYIPVGVWNVRETVRNMLKEKPEVFDSLEKSLQYISSKLEIPVEVWIRNSRILRNFYSQKKVSEFTL
jgi:hypothetical protein